MNALEIEIELMFLYNFRRNIIVPNVSWGIWSPASGALHECDLLILSEHNYATEIEIKTSRSDLAADKKKKHGHRHNHIARLYFAVPVKLVDFALSVIPEEAGLYAMTRGKKPELIKQCRRNKNCVQWDDYERLKLAHLGAMRIVGLKEKIAKLTN